MCRITAAAILALVFAAMPSQATKQVTDKEKIQGTWVGVAQTQGDRMKEMSAKAVIGAEQMDVEIGETKFTVAYKLYSDKNPKAIDMVLTRGDEKVKIRAIYAIEADVLKICWNAMGGGPPAEFSVVGKKNEDLRMLTLKRQKKR